MTDPEPDETTSDTLNVPMLPAGLYFWWSAYCGTVAAGSAFGALIAAVNDAPSLIPFGLLFGIFLAGLVAIPIHITVGIMTWTLWLSRFRLIFAGLAGGATGVVAAGGISGPPPCPEVFWAGAMGLGGSTVGGVWAIRRCRKLPKTGSDNRVWQFTLRDLFWRTTVFAMLVAAWTSIIRWFVSDIH